MDEKMRIMIVDDEKIVRESLYHWFKRSGPCGRDGRLGV